jgi:hypothetical protein
MLKFLSNLALVPAAVLAGNWVGAQIRYIFSGQRTYALQSEYTSPTGMQMRNMPVITKFYPGLLLTLFGKPRWFFGFLGGLLTGIFVDDQLENLALEMLSQRIAQLSENRKNH